MESIQTTRHENINVVSSSKFIICDARQFFAAQSTAIPARHLPTLSQLLEAAIGRVAASIPTAEGEDTFNSLSHRPISEERLRQGLRPLHPVHRLGWWIWYSKLS